MHRIGIIGALLAFFSVFYMAACSQKPEQKVVFKSIKEVPESSWEKLAGEKIFFGHQSVGNNIIDGIKDLMKENPHIKLNIIRTSDKAYFKRGVFAHFAIGKNENPQSKIDDFARMMDEGIGNRANIAFMKFCFVDIESNTDTNALFAEYRNKMSILEKKYPKTTFVHFTVPLLKQESPSLWNRIKKIFRKKEGFFDNSNNIARNKYNKLLKKNYEGKEPVFDLAKIESTRPDGTRETFTRDGQIYYALVPAYTKDGGHLNEVGRKKVAEQLLLLLVSLPS